MRDTSINFEGFWHNLRDFSHCNEQKKVGLLVLISFPSKIALGSLDFLVQLATYKSDHSKFHSLITTQMTDNCDHRGKLATLYQIKGQSLAIRDGMYNIMYCLNWAGCQAIKYGN